MFPAFVQDRLVGPLQPDTTAVGQDIFVLVVDILFRVRHDRFGQIAQIMPRRVLTRNKNHHIASKNLLFPVPEEKTGRNG